MSTYTVGKDIQALVADIGSYSTKIGYAGDDHPTAIYNSTTAIERNTSNTNNNGSNFINGPKRDFTTRPLANSENNDGNYELVNPINSTTGWAFSPPSQTYTGSSFNNNNENENNMKDKLGDVWESHELINRYLDHAFTNNLGLGNSNSQDSVSNHPLLLLDKSHTPPAIRQRLCEVLFETHDFPAVFFLRDAIAACYAVGKTTATVVDVGYSSTTVTPVYEGFVETRGVLRNNACGGKSVEEQVLKMMDGIVKEQGGINRKQRLRRECVKKIDSMNSNSGGGEGEEGNNKRDASGHFKKAPSLQPPPLSAIPDYLMPIYQVRRTPTYTPRSGPFHNWSRMTLARELKEGGLGVAVGPLGYVTTATARANAAAAASGEGEGVGGETNNPSSINPATVNNMFLTSSKLPYKLPDGTNVEIPTSSRCDVVELFFGNDEYNTNYREQVFDDTVTKLEEYEGEIEKLLSKKKDDDEEDEESNKDKMMGITSSSAGEAGDPYSNTSYRGEKTQRHGGKKTKTYYPPSTISKKLYTACLPYIRTAPPNDDVLEGADGTAAASAPVTSINDNYFHYLTSAPPAQMVCDAAFRCDRDQQAALLGNVVVCGGGSCITGAAGVGTALGGGAAGTLGTAGSVGGAVASALGDEHAFPDRLREEIESIVHRHTPGWRVKLTSPNITERAICSWLGGSILGSLGTFQDMWISKRDYEEFGSAIVNRKCP